MHRITFMPAALLALSLVAGCGDDAATGTGSASAAVGTATGGTTAPATAAGAPAEVSAVPEGFHTLTPHIVVDDVDAAVELYTTVFGATKKYAMPGPDGKTMHAEINIGDSPIMIAVSNPERGSKSPKDLEGTATGIQVYVEDVDAAVKAMVDAGGEIKMPIGDMFWGDRFGEVIGPFGHRWGIATHKKDAPMEAMEERGKEFAAAMAAGKPPRGYPEDPDATSYIPEGTHAVTPSLHVNGAADAIEWYKTALGAEEIMRMPYPGKDAIMHAELKVGDSVFYVSDAMADQGSPGPADLGGTSMTVHVYVDDADALFNTAKGAGAEVAMPMGDMPWGDRYGLVTGKDGHRWAIATHKEDLTPEEINSRMMEAMKASAGSDDGHGHGDAHGHGDSHGAGSASAAPTAP